VPTLKAENLGKIVSKPDNREAIICAVANKRAYHAGKSQKSKSH
jgi:hypothetical protein